MKILWLGRTLPAPLDAGDRIYTARLVEAVAQAGAAVTFIGLAPERGDRGRTALASNVEWRLAPGPPAGQLAFLLSRLPMASARFGTAAHRQEVATALAEGGWDAVVLDQYSLVWALPLLRRAAYRGVVVHIAHDFETQVTRDIADVYAGNPLRKSLLAMNARRTAAAERALADASQVIVTLTGRDRDEFRALNPQATILVLPPGYRGPVAPERSLSGSLPRRVVTVGSFEWTAKQINLKRFLAAADERFASAGIEFRVIGRVPADLQASLPPLRATRLLGFVDDLSAEFAAARAALVFDETGGGFKLKMLDYIFARVPVFGLRDALDVLPSDVFAHTGAATGMPELVMQVISAIDDIATLDRMQKGAATAAAGRFDWQANGKRLVEAIAKRAADVDAAAATGVPNRPAPQMSRG